MLYVYAYYRLYTFKQTWYEQFNACSCLYCNMSLHFIVMYVALLLQHDIICLKFVDNSNFISLYLNKKYKGEKIKFSTTQPYQYQDNNISQQLSYSPTFLEKLAVLICFSWYSIHNRKYFKSIIFQKE